MRRNRILLVAPLALIILGSAVIVLSLQPTTPSTPTPAKPVQVAAMVYNSTVTQIPGVLYHIYMTLDSRYNLTVLVLPTGFRENYSLYDNRDEAPVFFVSYSRLVQYFSNSSNFSSNLVTNESQNQYVHATAGFNVTINGEPVAYRYDLRYNATDGVLVFLNGTRSFPQHNEVDNWQLTNYQINATGVEALRGSANPSPVPERELPFGVAPATTGVALLLVGSVLLRRGPKGVREIQPTSG
jgi:hypothetical protein